MESFSLKKEMLEKYVQMAKKLGMVDAKIVEPGDIHFDSRTILKYRWGCGDPNSERCSDRGVPYETRVKMILGSCIALRLK